MAGRKTHHRFFAPTAVVDGSPLTAMDEFHESDVWGYDISGGTQVIPASGRSTAPTASPGVKKGHDQRSNAVAAASAASSLPMSIPDWSKTLGSSYGSSRRAAAEWAGYYYDGGDEEEEEKAARARPIVPPHELLCRSRAASFSVHEGLGRTLKGRDLSRVRNAIWAKTGFQH